ncbi:hypothetical protein pdam_00004384 [Pocillopora damicornis]|uniref:Uncharacterized protein n=2 Tax=Pocillopora damicornis TaxID=46731 RepID=A0A3M6UIU6_POCDA|nr:hypothetical protein pdam_00004384 [Pocillopora damicornis]
MCVSLHVPMKLRAKDNDKAGIVNELRSFNFLLQQGNVRFDMGHCWSCMCREKKALFRRGGCLEDWVFVDSDFEDDEETFYRDEALDEILSAFEEALSWPKEQNDFPNSTAIDAMNDMFCMASSEMSRLASGDKFTEADEIADAIVELYDVWGESVFSSLNVTFFTREEISLNRFTIKVGQYLKPEPLQERENDIAVKLYFFIVYDMDLEKYVCTYHLEYRDFSGMTAGIYFLRLKCRRGRFQVASYGESCPVYWKIRQDVLKDFSKRKRTFISC